MNYTSQTNGLAPQPVPNKQGTFNTAVAKAQASADPRFNMKAMDRNGVSRSAGTAATAGIQAAENLAAGIAAAYGQRDADAVADANNTLQFQANQENFGLGVAGIAAQNDYANALAALQRTQNTLQYQGNALGGLVGNAGNTSSFGNYNGTYRF
jgi:hypothetical protein